MLAALLISTSLLVSPDTTLLLPGGTEVSLVRVEPGEFLRDRGDGSRQTVVITAEYWIARYETTRAVWSAVLGGRPVGNQPTHPIRDISWFEIQDFLTRAGCVVDGWTFRLPTEGEWEYAARAGSVAQWSSGDDSLAVLEYAWFRGNAGGVVRPVGSRRPNAWGIHDMHGNVWEWVADWTGPYPASAIVIDPQGPGQGTERVRRGGSAVYGAEAARLSYRYRQPPGRGNGNLGFRFVALPEEAGTVPEGTCGETGARAWWASR